MNYKLTLNASGLLNGWQDICYELAGMKLVECQKFNDGVFQEWSGFIQVFNENTSTAYNFEATAWGSQELARDAAERFAVYGDLNCVQTKDGTHAWKVCPNTEEALV